ncbi:MAG: nitroreductase [Chloroflexota bacterium]|nr:MAG: nitroreductase [Chloroflexota bacterium]
MDVHDAVRTMLAVRAYQDRPVPAEAIRRIVDAGRMTGSARNAQPWHFVVVENRDRLREIAALSGRAFVGDAAFAIAVAVVDNRFGVSDGSRAIQSMMLAAWSEGIGSNWAGFAGMLDPVKAPLAIPAELSVLALVAFGYPVASLGRGKKKRKALGEVASRERYGARLE